MKNLPKWVKKAQRAEGGNVQAIPFGVDKTADALTRMKNAGTLDPDAAKAFAASRLQSSGINPKPVLGIDASYKRGGRADRRKRK